MGLGRIAPYQRGRFRWHALGLGLWVSVVGALSTVLLYHAGVHSLSARYALSALAIYGVGFLLGGWVYARWWAERVADEPVHEATPGEEAGYEQASRSRFEGFDGLGDFGFSGGDDPLSAILGVIGLILLSLAVLYLLGLLPFMLTDVLAGFLAEVVLECVAGAVVVRRMARRYGVNPRYGFADYWPHMLSKTIWVGLIFVLAAWVVGWCLHAMSPQAQTLWQALAMFFGS